MEKSKATADILRDLSVEFKKRRGEIFNVDSNLTGRFNKLEWNDPVGQNFWLKYEELKVRHIKPLDAALEIYSKYLEEQAVRIDEYNAGLL